MVDVFKGIKGYAESLMSASGSLFVMSESVDDEGYTRTHYKPCLDFKCRLRFQSANYDEDDKNAISDIDMTLFTPYDVNFKEGSFVKVRQNDACYFLVTSKVKAYSSHREYSVKEVDRWL
ncbi:MAG: hypothetical protein SOZ22_00140 [Ezakiella sp.]|nr:hypothetical protein [Ezakiella sp.]